MRSAGPVIKRSGLFVVAMAVAGASGLIASEPASKKPAVDTFPPPKSPAEALDSMRPRPGFRVELVAAEPLIRDPIAFDWGPDGKLWVVEMADYPLGVKGKPGGRVRFLEDRDGDGRYDTSTVFLEGLEYPNGVAAWRDGVLVSCTPDIFYAEDSTPATPSSRGALGAVRRVLFTGFSPGNPQHMMNGFRWGLDNWMYGGGDQHATSITAVQTGKRFRLGRRDFRIRPDEGLLDPQTGQTQYVRCRDDWGNWFGSTNSNPGFHFVLADGYLRRNRYLRAPNPRVTISEVPGAAPVFPSSRTLPRFNDQNKANRFTSACGLSIYRDVLFGEEFYGNTFVCEPVHNLVHREIVSPDGVTFRSRRADDEQQSEFLTSTDNWFRPTMTRTGPDGALWIADMYRQVIEHPEWIPDDWQKRLDLRAGHEKGRIYRVYPEGARLREIPRTAELPVSRLVSLLGSPNGPQRDMAHQMLVWRSKPASIQGDGSASSGERQRREGPRRLPVSGALRTDLVELLEKTLSEHPRATARLHALCVLDGIGELKDEHCLKALSDDHPGVRRHAVRLSESRLADNPQLAAAVLELVGSRDSPRGGPTRRALERSPAIPKSRAAGSDAASQPPGFSGSRGAAHQVQMQLAYSLGEWKSEKAGRALGRLALRHADDPYLRTAVMSSVLPHLEAVTRTVLAESKSPPPKLLQELLSMAASSRADDVVVLVVQAISRPIDGGPARHEPAPSPDSPGTGRYALWQLQALGGLLDAVSSRSLTLNDYRRRVKPAVRASLDDLDNVLAFARTTAADPDAALERRLAAVDVLGLDESQQNLDLLSELLSPQTPLGLQKAAVSALARLTGSTRAGSDPGRVAPEAPKLLLAGWPSHGPQLRSAILDVLFRRAEWQHAVLEALEQKTLSTADLDASRRQALLNHRSESIRRRAEKLFEAATTAGRQQVLDRHRAVLMTTGDAERGETVFNKHCAACHRLGEKGHPVGPDLTALTDKSPEALLVAMLDPNRAVESKFHSYVAVTADGRTFSGLLVSETGGSIALLEAEGKRHVLTRAELAVLRSSGKSLMPEGLEKDLKPRDFADVIAFLGKLRPPRKRFPGNEPKIVQAEALRGEFWLVPRDCEIYGDTLVLEQKHKNLGYWQSENDLAAWTIDVQEGGGYRVSLEYACPPDAAGNRAIVEVAGRQIAVKIESTGSWDAYRQVRIGRVELSPGKHRLTVRSAGRIKGALFDLKTVRLRP